MNKTVKKEVESSCEYILPDYMGDIKKVLYSRAWGMPGGKYVSGKDAEHSGVVEYEILYADADNRLTAVTASSDYSQTVSITDADMRDSFHKCRISGFNVRTTGPRKLSLKSTVELSITMIPEVDGVENLCDGVDIDNMQKNTVQIKNEVYEHIATSEREIAEQMERIAGVPKDDVEIILNSGEVRISDVRLNESGVSVKGELIVDTIKRVQDTPPYSTKKSYPFEHRIEVGTLADDIKLIASGVPSSITVGMSEEGEDTVLYVNAIAEINLYGIYNREQTVITDAYSLEFESDNRYSELEYNTLTDIINTEFHLDERASKSTLGLSSVRDVLIMSAAAECFGCEVDHRTIKINGEVVVNGVACEINEDNNISYLPFKHTFPFSHNVNINCQIDAGDSVGCELTAWCADAAIDAQGVYFKVTVGATVKASSKKSVKYLCECHLGEGDAVRPSRSRITVYYPSMSETLFDIAKKHHTTTEKLCIDNSISDETLSGGSGSMPKKLIIK